MSVVSLECWRICLPLCGTARRGEAHKINAKPVRTSSQRHPGSLTWSDLTPSQRLYLFTSQSNTPRPSKATTAPIPHRVYDGPFASGAVACDCTPF